MRFKEYLNETVDQFLTYPNDINIWMKDNDADAIFNIRDNGIVDVYSDLNLGTLELTRLPIQFGIVKGFMNVADNPLTSLIGCPTVADGFDCSNTHIDTFMHVPNSPIIYSVENTKLTTLEHLPLGIKRLHFSQCPHINSLLGIEQYAPQLESIVFSYYMIERGGLGLLLIPTLNEIIHTNAPFIENRAITIIKKYIGRPDDIFECQAELIENGLEEFALL